MMYNEKLILDEEAFMWEKGVFVESQIKSPPPERGSLIIFMSPERSQRGTFDFNFH